MNWDSDLFFIDDTIAVGIGNINGVGCDTSNPSPMIVVSKLEVGPNGPRRAVTDSLPFGPTFKSGRSKWEFIEEYWSSHWQEFNPPAR